MLGHFRYQRRAVAPLWGACALGTVLGLSAGPDVATHARTSLRGVLPRPRETIVLVVMDTVRADHTSVCGYGRATTPTLEALAARGASVACRAIAPGSWTLPSHASFFTGLTPLEHGARFTGRSDVLLNPLPAGVPTLAEELGAQGYHTVLVSASPVLGGMTGLDRGFDTALVGPTFGPGGWSGKDVARAVTEAAESLPLDGRPLFLTVNLLDAHHPFPAGSPSDLVPGDRPPVALFDGMDHEESTFGRFTAEWSPQERAAFLPNLVDAYDSGVRRADDGLGSLLAGLEHAGWLGDDWRLVVTADHGEYLGEHGLVDHGRYTYEPNQRVPVVYYDPKHPVAVPDDMPGLDVYDLVLNGRLDASRPAVVPAGPDATWARESRGAVGRDTSVSVWRGSIKETWISGRYERFDLDRDPHELAPQPLAPEDVWPELREGVRKNEEFVAAQLGVGPSPDDVTLGALRAVGYLE